MSVLINETQVNLSQPFWASSSTSVSSSTSTISSFNSGNVPVLTVSSITGVPNISTRVDGKINTFFKSFTSPSTYTIPGNTNNLGSNFFANAGNTLLNISTIPAHLYKIALPTIRFVNVPNVTPSTGATLGIYASPGVDGALTANNGTKLDTFDKQYISSIGNSYFTSKQYTFIAESTITSICLANSMGSATPQESLSTGVDVAAFNGAFITDLGNTALIAPLN